MDYAGMGLVALTWVAGVWALWEIFVEGAGETYTPEKGA